MNFKKILSMAAGIVGSLFIASGVSASRNNRFLKVSVSPVFSSNGSMTISRFENDTQIDEVKIMLDDYRSENRELTINSESTPKFMQLWDRLEELIPAYSKLNEAQDIIRDFRFYFNRVTPYPFPDEPHVKYVKEHIRSANRYVILFRDSKEIYKLRKSIVMDIMEMFAE